MSAFCPQVWRCVNDTLTLTHRIEDHLFVRRWACSILCLHKRICCQAPLMLVVISLVFECCCDRAAHGVYSHVHCSQNLFLFKVKLQNRDVKRLRCVVIQATNTQLVAGSEWKSEPKEKAALSEKTVHVNRQMHHYCAFSASAWGGWGAQRQTERWRV